MNHSTIKIQAIRKVHLRKSDYRVVEKNFLVRYGRNFCVIGGFKKTLMEEQFLVLEMFVKVGEDIDIDADFVGSPKMTLVICVNLTISV